MYYPSGQMSIVNSLPRVESARFFRNISNRFETSLLIETVLVTTAAISAIRFLTESSISGAAWLLTPCILVAAALIPTVTAGRTFAKISLDINEIKSTVLVLCCTCAVVFPAMLCGLLLLKSYGMGWTLRPVLPQGKGWFSWLFYQFMYVAVAEEVFFRGYLQSNILRLTSTVKWEQYIPQNWITIVLSAACFAAAHIIVQGTIIAALTFLPGLVLGWLFIRTKSLLAPILFHGLANTVFCITTAALA